VKDSVWPRQQLDPDRVIASIGQLRRRISERFPDAPLVEACDGLQRLGQEAKRRATWVSRPIIWLRVGAAMCIALIATGLVGTLSQLEPSSRPLDMVLFVNVMEAGINNLVLLAIATFFLVTIETRIKRNRSLVALHELRSLAHIIDMHQLTKDPDRLLFGTMNTESSPVNDMGVLEMSRYLDYCCEMLSLVGKIAAIYGLHWHDAVSIQAVNDVERLTTGMSQKIFQKVMILHGDLSSTGYFSQPRSQVMGGGVRPLHSRA
jgi:hypothetical protein